MKRREEGSIEERIQGKKYLIRWMCAGCERYKHTDLKRHNRIVKGDSVEAQSELARVLRPIEGQPAPPTERTFASYMENEWAQYTRDKWKDSTQITQGSFVTKHIRPYFDGMRLSKITPSDIVSFHQSLEAKKLSKKTRRTIHAILATMFNYATDTLELISKSPVKKSLAPKLEKREKASLSSEQAWALWDALVDPKLIRYRAFYGVLLFTGIRTGEALGLTWEDLDFADRQFTVKRAIYRGRPTSPKTDASLRTRPISPELYTALVNHKAMAHYTAPTDYVFASSSGRAANPDQLREALQGALRKKLGIHLGPREDGLHLLRHTSGSLVYRQTHSIKDTQAWLGHSSTRVTMDVYTHLMQDAQKKTAETVFTRPAVPATAPERQN
jgi:integrase